MASRVVEVLYRLRDFFTPEAKKVERAYDDLAKGADDGTKQVERANTRLTGSLAALQSKLNAFRNFARGGVIGTAILGFGKLLASANREILNLSKSADRLGVTEQQFLDLQDTAREANIEFSDLEQGVRDLNEALQEAEAGSASANERLAEVGVTAAELRSLDPAQQILRLAQAFEDLGGTEVALSKIAELLQVEPGDGILLLIEQGPEAFRRIAERAAETGRVVDDDLVEASRRYLELSNRIARTWDEITGSIKNAAVIGVGNVLETFGIGDDEEVDLEKERLELIERRRELLRNLQTTTSRSIATQNRYKDQLEDTNQALKENEESIINLRLQEGQRNRLSIQRAETQRRAAQAEKEYAQELDNLTEAYEAQSDALKKVLREQTAELKAARREQSDIEQEFKDLVEDITGEDLTPEDVNLGSVFGQINIAKAQKERGEFEAAVETARKGGEFLELLKEKGTETQGTLTFLANQLKQVAVESAKAKADAEQEDIAPAEQALQAFQGQLEALKAGSKTVGIESAQEFLEGWRQVIAANPLPTPEVQTPTPSTGTLPSSYAPSGGATPGIRREGNSFYQTQLISEREQRGGKGR